MQAFAFTYGLVFKQNFAKGAYSATRRFFLALEQPVSGATAHTQTATHTIGGLGQIRSGQVVGGRAIIHKAHIHEVVHFKTP